MIRKFLHNKQFALFIFLALFTLFNVCVSHKVDAGNIVNTSIFTSQVEDFGSPVYFDQFSWTASTTAGVTDVAMEVRAGSTSNPISDTDPNWSAWTGVTNGDNVSSSVDGHRYFQYRATMTSQDINQIASFSDVIINWSRYYTGPVFLTSSFYDASDNSNALGGVGWIQNTSLPVGSSVTFYLRSASSTTALASAAWTEIASSTSTYLTPGCINNSGTVSCDGSVVPASMKDGISDEFLQYKIGLSSNGLYTPIISGVNVKYVVNAPPEISIQGTVSETSDGSVVVNYQARDIDTNTGATPGQVAVNLQYCTANCSSSGSEIWANASAGALNGDIGAGVSVNQASTTEFTTHSVTWNPKIDYNNHYNGTDFKVRLVANDSEAVNNLAYSESNNFVLDTTNPIVSSFVVDSRLDAPKTLTISYSDDTLNGLQMRISNNSNLSADGMNSDSGVWIAATSTKSWNLSGVPKSIYYQFKDKYGNLSNAGAISNVTIPAQPSSIVYQDVSNVSTSEWREFVAWGEIGNPSLGFKQYNIYRSIDGVNYSLLATQTDRTINYIIDTSLNTQTTYYYKVSAEDNAGNISNYSAVVFDAPNGQGGSDLTAPKISSVAVSSVGTQSALITWNTDEPSDSNVEYIITTGGDFTNAPSQGISTMSDHSGNLGQHSVVLNGLSPNTSYYFEVKSADPSGNLASNKYGTNGYTFTTLSGPKISNVSNVSTDNQSATITWNTDVISDSYVVYSVNPDMSGSVQVGLSDSVTNHAVTINGLTSGVRYYYYVKSGVAVDKNVVNGVDQYYTFTTTVDLTPPTINFATSTGITDITDTSATISWSTNELATSSLVYGLDTNYGTTLTNSNLNINQTYVLTGLTPGTVYHIQLGDTDASGNTMVSSDYSFSTTDSTDHTPPVVTFATSTDITDITNTTATISWTTNEVATSEIDYGLDTSYASSSVDSSLNSQHSFTLTGLTKSMLYHFRLVNTDASGNIATSTDYTFSTIDTNDYTPPTINFATSTGITDITDTSVTISWTTNELATSSLAYGLNTSYGSTLTNANLNINHTYIITGLTPGTAYHIQLGDTDASGNTMVSSDYSFSTTDSTDHTPPAILNATTTPIFDTIAVVNWDTNRLTTSTVEYGTKVTNLTSTVIDSTLNTSHAIALSPLTPSTTYYYKITATDSNGNSVSSDGSFSTVETLYSESAVQNKVALAEALGAASSRSSSVGGGGVLIINKQDIIPPTISQVKIFNITANSASVSWITDESADSFVAFGLSTSYGTIAGSRSRTMNHQVDLENLQAGTIYHLNVSSVDASGNYIETGDKTFTTLSIAQALKAAAGSPNSISTSTSPNNTNQTADISNLFNLASQAVQRIVGVIKNNVSSVSLNAISSSLGIQQNSLNELANFLPTPIMSGSPAVTMTDKSATINWQTDKNSNSLVAYADAGTYQPQSSNPYLQVVGQSNEQVTSHSVTIDNLTPNTVYHYQLQSKPSVGPAAMSKDFTFRTKPEALNISKYDISNVTPTSASFQWVTSTSTSASVSFVPYKNGKLDTNHTQTKRDSALSTIHNINLTGFTPGVTYQVTLTSKDTTNNMVQQVINNFLTNKTASAPAIGQVQTISAISPGKNVQIQTVISWVTSEPSTSQVYYTKGVAKAGDVLPNSTNLDDNYTTKHVVVITSFDPGSIYTFQTESVDYNNMKTLSKMYTIMTPQQEDSVFQVIIKNFQGIFGWVNQINK